LFFWVSKNTEYSNNHRNRSIRGTNNNNIIGGSGEVTRNGRNIYGTPVIKNPRNSIRLSIDLSYKIATS
jgi:hypothetical protein